MAVGEIPAFFLYGEPLQSPNARTVHIETIAARSRLHDWHIAAHRHRDLHQILVVHRGWVQARLDDRDELLRAPALVIVPPGTVHGFVFEEHTKGLVVSFSAELARELARPAPGLLEFLESPAARALSAPAVGATEIPRLGEMLLRESQHSAADRDLALSGLLAALVANVRRVADWGEAEINGAAAKDRELVARFRRTIDRLYREHASIAQYARELEVSERQLRRACLAAVGQSPIDLIHRRMLVEAERQLRYTAMPVAEVAYYCGFEDPAYFTRFFSRRTGMSPRAFRERGALR